MLLASAVTVLMISKSFRSIWNLVVLLMKQGYTTSPNRAPWSTPPGADLPPPPGLGQYQPAHPVSSTGRTKHAESIEIKFDSSRISYGTLLKVLFSVAHDPTQLNYQGPDIGPQYRSAIFYANEEQHNIAKEYIRILEEAKAFPKPIVTQVVPLDAFYPAEEYHQNFLVRNPYHPYIVYWDIPKLEHLKREHPELLAK